MNALLSRWWDSHRSAESRLARRVTTAATLLFLLIVCAWKPWELFARGGFSADFYDAQAHAFLQGRLDVDASVAGPEGFLINGRTYLYYGPLLAILRMPFALFGHWADGRLSRASMTLGFFSACTLSRYVVAATAATFRSHAGSRRQALLTVAVAVSPALSLAGWNTVYHETEMWALAFFMATIVALLRLWSSPSRRTFASAAIASICVVLTRSSVGFGALAATGLVGALLWRRHRRVSVASVVTMGLGVALSVVLNVAKFATPFDLPAGRQLLSLQNPQRAAWFAGNDGSFFGLRFLPTTLAQYFRPDTVQFERLLPFIRFGPLAPNYGSYPLETVTPSSSLPTAATLLCLLAIVGVGIIVRRRPPVMIALLVGAVVAAVPSFLIGFVAHRYLVDMLPSLIVPAAVATAVVPLPRWLSVRRAVALLAVVASWGLAVNVALGTWIQNLKEPGFTELRYAIDDVFFDGPAPSVIRLPTTGNLPRDGVVAVDGACNGLYIAEQSRWVALELADGRRKVEGHVDPTDPTLRVTTPQGVLVVSISEQGVTTAFQQLDGELVGGEPTVGVTGSGSATDRIAVESDPVTGRFVVTVGGELAFFMFGAPDLSQASFSESWTADVLDDGGTPICNRLVARTPALSVAHGNDHSGLEMAVS